MTLVGNIIWLLCGGFASGLAYVTGGAGMCLSIIGIPWGIQSIKLGLATLMPFGLEVEHERGGAGLLDLVANLIWLVCFGWWIALHHVLWAFVLAITIIGLPFAKQHAKLVPLALWPFGKTLR